MIDKNKLKLIAWEETTSQFGYKTPNELNNQSKVKVICQDCKLPKLTTTVASMRKRPGKSKYEPICKSCQQKRTWQKREYRQSQSSAQSIAMRKVWESEEYRTKQSKSHTESSKRAWQNEEYRKKVAKGVSTAHATIEGYTESAVKALRSNDEKRLTVLQQKRADPNYVAAYAAKMSSKTKKLWESQEYKNKQNAIRASAAYRSKLSKNAQCKTQKHHFNIQSKSQNTVEFDFTKCDIGFPEAKDANIFFSKYHYIASGGRNGTNIGCYIDNKLIACARFCNPTRAESATRLGLNQKELSELTRFCIKSGYNKKNFASWFLSRCVRHMNKKCLITFADSTFGHTGTIYKASGWTLDGIVQPDYFYIDNDGYVIHKRTLWSYAVKMSMTEKEYSEKYGYVKKWGKEKYRYIKWIQ